MGGSSNILILYGTGSNHKFVAPSSVKPQYLATYEFTNVCANIEGATFFEPNSVTPNHSTDYTAAFFECYLSDIEKG